MPQINLNLNIRRRTKYFDLVDKEKVYKKFKSDLRNYNRYLRTHGLEFGPVIIRQRERNLENLQRDNDGFKLEIHERSNINEAVLCQNAKDKANLSEKSYNDLRSSLSEANFNLPSLYKLNNVKKRINEYFEVTVNNFGAYVNVRQKIDFVLGQIYNLHNKIIEDNTFSLLICGDGTLISKTRVNILNFTFKVINENDQSFNGQYTLGIFEIKKENNENIRDALTDISNQLDAIDSISIENRQFKINKLAGGDLKWLAIIFGIGAANSDYPCVWCDWNCKNEIGLNDEWSIYTRSQYQANECIQNTTTETRRGYKFMPLFKSIEFYQAIADPLHMNLRIIENLLDKLNARLEELDGNNSLDLTKRPLFKVLYDFLENNCNLQNPFYNKVKENNDSKIKMRSLNQSEKFRILETMFKKDQFNNTYITNLFTLYPNHREDNVFLIINYLLREYLSLINYIKSESLENYSEVELKGRLKTWLSFYIKLKKRVTPYIHIFVYHVPEFISVYKDFNLFSMQGLEKLNGVVKRNYFSQTNKKKGEYYKQLLDKANRLDIKKFDFEV